jgi:hypothetical protein
LRYDIGVDDMSRCSFRLLLAVVLGAGAPLGLATATLAGDKIEFSWSSERTLAAPAVEHPQDDPDLPFARSSTEPVVDLGYPMPETVTVVPNKLNNRLNGRNGGSDTIFGNRQQDGSLDNADGRQDDYGNSSDAGTNLSRGQKSWDFGSAHGSDDRSLGYGAAGLDPTDPYARRDPIGDSHSGRNGENSWTGRPESSFSKALGYQKTSVFDLIRQREQSRFSPQIDSYTPDAASGDAYGGAAPLAQPGAEIKTDIRTAPGGDYSLDSRSSGGPNADSRGPIPDARAWDTPLNRDPLYQPGTQPRYVPPAQAQSQAQSHPSRLSFPKRPGSIGY